MIKNDLLLRAAKGEEVERAPVWLMRQAGRVLPEYRAVRAKSKNFIEFVKNPELAAEVTVQPVDILGVDAAIIFSDILVIPEAMGLPYQMIEAKGPWFEKTIATQQDVDSLIVTDGSNLQYVYDAIRLAKKQLDNRVPLIGFCGAPWTLLAYMVEGSGSKTFSKAKKFLYTQPKLAHQTLEKIAQSSINYLLAQVEAGANLIQIFDSWAGVLSPEMHKEFSLKYMSMICDALSKKVPVTIFAKDAHFALAEIKNTSCSVVGLDWSVNPAEARKIIGAGKTLQGNADPCLLYADYDEIEKQTKHMLNAFGKDRYIANLGHGLYPDTEKEKVKFFVDCIKNIHTPKHLKHCMRKLWLHIVLFFVAAIGFSQTYDFRNYNVEDGLAQSQVNCIFQDSKGYMWFGTGGGGLSMYDGKTFKNLSPGNGAISNTVYSVAEDKNQNLYFATYDGLQIKNKFKDIRIDTGNGLPANTAYRVFIDKSEKIWIGTQLGVCYLNEKQQPVKLIGNKLLESSGVFTIYQDNAGNYWFGTIQHGACCYSPTNNTYTWYDITMGMIDNFVRSFNEDSKGTVYIGTVAGLYEVGASKKMKPVNIPGLSLRNLAVTSINKDKNNVLWLATNEGVVKYNGLSYQNFLVENGLCGNLILSSYIDSEGNLWFGSDGFGVSKLSSEAVVNYSEKDGLPGDYINCIYQTRDKKYWIAMRDEGVLLLDGKEKKRYEKSSKNAKENLIDNNVNCMAQDKEGKLWMGTQAGLSVLSEGRFINYWAQAIDQIITIYSICHSSTGVHYIGTGNGLVVFGDNGKKEPVDIVNKLKGAPELAIYNIVEDNEHNLWLATASYGVIKYDGKSAEIFNAKNKFTDKSVYNVVKDKSGNLWFGTEDGVFYYNHKEFVNIGEKDGLISNQVYFLVLDDKNRLWIGTNKGIDAMQINDFVTNKKVNVKHFGKEEGLKGSECNFNSAIKDDEGKLWFGTVKGVTMFNPHFEKTNYQEPSCLITDIKIFFEKTDLAPYAKSLDSLSGLPIDLKLPYSKNHVTFDFIGISQTNPNKVLYQFKLDGVDGDWVPVTSKTEVTYSSLQPGTYTFHLKAMNNDGFWNKEPLQYTFKVLPPWYRTWWAYTLYVIIVVASVYGYNSYKTKKLYADKVKLEKQVAARTRELREEKQKVELINKEVIEQKATIEHKNLEMTDSIKYAKNIQEALLPAITNLRKDFPESFVLYMPKDIVSGDFYWFANRDGKHLFAAADCTGHGVPGAFMSIIGNSLLNEIIGEQHIYQPAEILNNLHVGVKTALNHNKGEFERRDGMDIALCSFNKENMTLEYAGANRALWLYRKGEGDKAEIIKPDKFPIGGLEFDFEVKRQFTNHTIQLQKDDCIYIFSDGYADQFGGEKGKKFMVANLQRTFAEITDKPMEEQYQHLRKVFTDWRGAYEQIDDVLVIGVRV